MYRAAMLIAVAVALFGCGDAERSDPMSSGADDIGQPAARLTVSAPVASMAQAPVVPEAYEPSGIETGGLTMSNPVAALGEKGRAQTVPDAPVADDPEVIIRGSEVLYFTDSVLGTDQVLAGLELLQSDGAIDLVTAASRGEAVSLMGSTSEVDVVVYFNQSGSLGTEDEDALVNWVNAGGRLIFADWTFNTRVLAAIQSSQFAGATNETPLEFTDERLAVGVTNPTPLSNPGWGVWSMGLQPVGDAVSVAAFPSGASGLVYGNDGRTVNVGFLNDTIDADDGRNFTRNLVRLVIEGSVL